MKRAAQVHAKLVATNGYAIERQSEIISWMTKMVGRNHAELRVAIQALIDPRLAFPVAPGSEHNQRDQLFEIARRLDNYLASVISRVERTCVMASALRSLDTTLVDDCRMQFERLQQRPTYRLAEYLRDHTIHVGIHGLQCEMKFKPAKDAPVSSAGVPAVRVFIVKPLAKPARSRRGKKRDTPLMAFPDLLEIESLSEEFNKETDVFVSWYLKRLQKLYDVHGVELDRLREELRDVLAGVDNQRS